MNAWPAILVVVTVPVPVASPAVPVEVSVAATRGEGQLLHVSVHLVRYRVRGVRRARILRALRSVARVMRCRGMFAAGRAATRRRPVRGATVAGVGRAAASGPRHGQIGHGVEQGGVIEHRVGGRRVQVVARIGGRRPPMAIACPAVGLRIPALPRHAHGRRVPRVGSLPHLPPSLPLLLVVLVVVVVVVPVPRLEAGHALLGDSRQVPFDPPTPRGVVTADLHHSVQVNDIEEAGDEDLKGLDGPLESILQFEGRALVVLPPAVAPLVVPLEAVLKASVLGQVLASYQRRVVQEVHGDLVAAQGAALTLVGHPLDAEEAEDVVTRQLHWVDARL